MTEFQFIQNACTKTQRYRIEQSETDGFGGGELIKMIVFETAHYTNSQSFGKEIEISDTSNVVDALYFVIFDLKQKEKNL
jgi:hypothetical protein